METSATTFKHETKRTLAWRVENEIWQTILPEDTKWRLSAGAELLENEEDIAEQDSLTAETKKIPKYLKYIKIIVLFICWLIFTCLLVVNEEVELEPILICVPNEGAKEYELSMQPRSLSMGLKLQGPFKILPSDIELSETEHVLSTEHAILEIVVQLALFEDESEREFSVISDVWQLQVTKAIETSNLYLRSHIFQLYENARNVSSASSMFLSFNTSGLESPLTLQMYYEPVAVPTPTSIAIASFLLLGFYILLLFNIVHRTLGIMLACTFAIALLGLLHVRPMLLDVIVWMDFDSLLLIFSMVIIVSNFVDTGILNYIAVLGYQLANGHIWPLLNCLLLIVVICAAWLNSIVVMLLASPLTIRFSELFQLNPVPLLICQIVAANVVATLMPIADQPNSYIFRNIYVLESGISYSVYLAHIMPAVLLAMAQSYLHLRIQYHTSKRMRFTDTHEIERLRRVIKVLKHTATSFNTYSKEERALRSTVLSKVNRLRTRVGRLGKMPLPPENYEETLRTLKAVNPIRNKRLLILCCVVLAFVLILCTCELADLLHLSVGWIALLGAVLLLILNDTEDFEGLMTRMEWSSMLFFAALFIFTRAICNMGVLDYIGAATERQIMHTAPGSRLTIAIILILVISAIISGFLDSFTVSAAMLSMVFSLADQAALPLQPLIWSLVLGSCFGGNGSLIGAAANIIVAGVAESHGYSFTFWHYLKVGFLIMVGNVLVAMAYLLLAHVIFEWH